jgi:hypothetical protein
MKKTITIIVLFLFSFSSIAIAGDVYVDGYYRDDGTYVEPHIRSSPDNTKTNNYGPSQNDFERMNPRTRDYDNDGISNYNDLDSDNDGYHDDFDNNPYGNSNDDLDW